MWLSVSNTGNKSFHSNIVLLLLLLLLFTLLHFRDDSQWSIYSSDDDWGRHGRWYSDAASWPLHIRTRSLHVLSPCGCVGFHPGAPIIQILFIIIITAGCCVLVIKASDFEIRRLQVRFSHWCALHEPPPQSLCHLMCISNDSDPQGGALQPYTHL